MTIEQQLAAAETEMSTLLANMNEIDGRLSCMKPSDPDRKTLTQRKMHFTSRYQGAKLRVKELRRQLNGSLPVGLSNVAIVDELYLALVQVYDRALESSQFAYNVSLTDKEALAIRTFLDSYELKRAARPKK